MEEQPKCKQVDFKVGALVRWAADGDIGIVTRLDKTKGEIFNIFVKWNNDPGADGWHMPHPCLELLSSH